MCTVARFAGAEDRRFVWILLRGAMDGLSALVPIGDSDYARQRQQLTIEQPIKLNADWGLHPELIHLARCYQEGQLLAWPAVASPYRERSHFDGQNVLDHGGVAGAHRGSAAGLLRAVGRTVVL